MADQVSSWALKLEDQTSGAANTAAQALAKLEEQITADTKSLAAMQKAMKNLQGGSSVNIDQFRKLKTAIDAQKNSIAKAQGSFVSLGGAFKGATGSSKGLEAKIASVVAKQKDLKPPEGLKAFAGQLDGLSRQASALPGPMGSLVGKLGQLKTIVGGGAIAGGIMLIVAALLALVAATIVAVRALYNYGVAQADARRSEQLRLEGLTKMRFLFPRAAGNAKEMQEALDRVAAKVPASREQLSKYNDQLYKMGARGPQLEKALEGVGIKLAAQGEQAASSFAMFAGGAAITGRSVDKLVDKVKSRLGGIAQRQMASLTVQTLKQKEAMDSLFSGLQLEKYLNAWKEVNDLLTQATNSGRALKTLITMILQPLIDQSTSGAPLLKRFFQGMIIAALQLAIVVLTVRNWFRKTFGDKSLFSGIDWGRIAAILGKGTLVVLIGILAVLAFTFTMLALPIIRAVLGFIKLWQAISAVVKWVREVDFAVLAVKIVDGLLSIGKMIIQPLLDLGSFVIDGIVKGLKLEPLVARMKELALGGLKAFASAIGAASPAKAFVKLGLTIPQGVAEGVDAGAPEAQQSTANMVDAASTAPNLGVTPGGGGGNEPAATPAARGGGGGNTIEIGEVNVYASSGEPKQMAADFRRELEAVLEGLALEIGAPTAS